MFKYLKHLVALCVMGSCGLGLSQATHTFPATDTNNTFTGTNNFMQPLAVKGQTVITGGTTVIMPCTNNLYQLTSDQAANKNLILTSTGYVNGTCKVVAPLGVQHEYNVTNSVNNGGVCFGGPTGGCTYVFNGGTSEVFADSSSYHSKGNNYSPNEQSDCIVNASFAQQYACDVRYPLISGFPTISGQAGYTNAGNWNRNVFFTGEYTNGPGREQGSPFDAVNNVGETVDNNSPVFATFLTRSISATGGGSVNCWHIGDCQTRGYEYDTYDGGNFSAGSEGVYSHGLNFSESQGYYHGSVSSVSSVTVCAPLSSGSIPTSCSSGPTMQVVNLNLNNSTSGPNHVTDGTQLLDVTQAITGCIMTASPSQFTSRYLGVLSFTGCTAPVVKVLGLTQSVIGDTANQYTQNIPVSQTFAIAPQSVGGFTSSTPHVGFACLASVTGLENVRVTAVSGTNVTANVRYAHSSFAYFIQGDASATDACSPWYGIQFTADATYAANAQASAYWSFGSYDGTHLLVANFFQGGAQYYLDGNGDVPHGVQFEATGATNFSLVPMAEIVANNTPLDGNLTIQISDTGLFQAVALAGGGTRTLGTTSDAIIDPHFPTVTVTLFPLIHHTSQYCNRSFGCGVANWGYDGPGVNVGYRPFVLINNNPPSMYDRNGQTGLLDPPGCILCLGGPHDNIMNVPAPSSVGALINVESGYLGGSDTTPFRVVRGYESNSGSFWYYPTTHQFLFDTPVSTPSLQLLSTTHSCTSAQGGSFQYVAGSTGSKDIVQVCAKDASNTYAWRSIY